MSDVDTFLQPRDDAGQFAAEPPATPTTAAPAAPDTPPPAAAQAPEPVAPATSTAEPHKPPHQEMTDKERAFMAAARDERQKRQELERRLNEMEQAQKAPPKEFWEAPEEKLKEFEDRIQHGMLKSKIDMAESIARSRHQDFDEKVNVFAELLQNTPGLHEQWLSALDPAEFAYKAAENYINYTQAGSIDNVRAKIEAEVRAKVEAEYKAKELEREKKLSSIPNSLSNANGSGSSATPAWTGPASLESLLA